MEGVEERRDDYSTRRAEQIADTVEELTIRQNHPNPQPAGVPRKRNGSAVNKHEALSQPVVEAVVAGGFFFA